jgi:hypothetical protein
MPERKKFEHRIYIHPKDFPDKDDDKKYDDDLKYLGSQGWELVAVTEYKKRESGSWLRHVFKREIF